MSAQLVLQIMIVISLLGMGFANLVAVKNMTAMVKEFRETMRRLMERTGEHSTRSSLLHEEILQEVKDIKTIVTQVKARQE